MSEHNATLGEIAETLADLIQQKIDRQKWISIEDRLPEVNTDVLILDDWIVGIGTYHKFITTQPSEWQTYMSYEFTNYGGYTGLSIEHPETTSYVTHWMPLPAPPINREG